MNFLHALRRQIRRTIGPTLAASLALYFAYHAVQGERGLLAWREVSQRVELARVTLAETAAERSALAHRVGLLRPERPDRDMVDERARLMLNLGGPDEIVVPLDSPAR